MTGLRRVVAEQIPEPPGATWSNVLVVGEEVALSGVTPFPEARQAAESGEPMDVETQTALVLDKIDRLIESAGGHRGNIYRLVVYLRRIDDKTAVGSARRAFFEGQTVFPASTLVEVSDLVFPEIDVEIEAHARLDIDLRSLR